MELPRFLKQKRSWQWEPLPLSIYLPKVCKRLMCSQRELFGAGATCRRKVTQPSKFAEDRSHLWPACLIHTKCQQEAVSVTCWCFFILHEDSHDSWPLAGMLLQNKWPALPPGHPLTTLLLLKLWSSLFTRRTTIHKISICSSTALTKKKM